ncbi:MAG: hypothetical protein HY869_08680 [Chloroflexi bacterium]|nr:hypothetical protein [Chloroflexota bacterium]
MQRLSQSKYFAALLLALFTLLAYGLLAHTAGFHWDDWGFAWAARFLGPENFIPSFAGFRPFLGPIFAITTSFIPPNPLAWQLFALIIRFLIGLCAWWMFRAFWPNQPRLALTTALLVLVFPGYSQHWVALTHINQELIPFILYMLSFGISAHAMRKGSLPLTIAALLLQFGGLFPTEYFFGMEPLRFLLIWFMLDTAFLPRLRRTLTLWLPYLLLWIVDGLWLVWFYRSGAYVSYGLESRHLDWMTALADAVFKAGFYVWGQVLLLAGSALPAPTSLLTFGLVAVSAVILSYALLRFPRPDEEPRSTPHLPVSILLIGLVGILLGRLPSLAAGLPLTLQSTFDRFMISMTLGGSLFLAGLVEFLFRRNDRLKIIVLSLVIALGVGQQFYNVNLYRRDWARQQEIYWQFAWRIPALKPNTLLLTDVIPNLPLETDLSFTAPINWMYAPEYSGGDLPYALLYAEARLGGGVLTGLQPGRALTLPFRTVEFHGSTDAALVFLVPGNGCLRVLDPALGDAVTYEKESETLTQIIPLSKPSLILTDAPQAQLSAPPFGAEPEHAWCYFYEKAELARQVGDWQKILDLGMQARSLGYQPEDVFEWLPFIEAQARVGDVDEALALSRDSIRQVGRVRKGVCHVWERVQAQVPERSASSSQALNEFGCIP